MKHTCTLLDDDGVLVISTARQMEYWKDQDFNYDFPQELLSHMAQARIIAWESGGEGEHSVLINYLGADISRSEKKIGPFLLHALDDDAFIIMPYSTFTYAADCDEGKVEKPGRLVYRFNLPKGDYHIYLLKLPDETWHIDIINPDNTPTLKCADELPEP